MATTAATLVQRTRRYLRDWKSFDATTASVSASGTDLSVADSSIYAPRWPIEVDQELMMVASLATSVSMTVRRAQFGSTGSAHASNAAILIRPDYYSIELLDAVNEAILAMFPAIYKPVVDTSQTTVANTYVYPIPTMPGYTNYPMPFVTDVGVLLPGDYTYRRSRRWELVRGASTSSSTTTTSSSSLSPGIRFRSVPYPGGTLQIRGYGPFPALVNQSDTLDTLFPPSAEYLIPIYAAGSMLMSGEAGRTRVDTGAVDAREQAQRTGASMQIGMSLINRFRVELLQGAASSAMPPMPRHAKTVI